MIYCGIDPGFEGAIAFLEKFLNAPPTLKVYDMPVDAKGINTFQVVMLLNTWKPDRLVLEDQFASKFGKMSKESTLTMGQNWGRVVGAAEALRIQTHLVLPKVWQAKLAPKRIFQFEKSKDRSFAACRALFPGVDFGKHDGRADAALLAKYAETFFS